jgi:membrane-associated phospholipid phosphatase
VYFDSAAVTALTTPPKPAPLVAKAGAPAGLLAWARRNFLAMDVITLGFISVLMLWTLVSLVWPGARLYAYDVQYAWAEQGKIWLLLKLGLIGGVYAVLQRFGLRHFRDYGSWGRRAPKPLSIVNLVYTFSPLLLIPLVFNLLGAFIAGVSGVPAAHTHPDFLAGALYDPAASWWDFELKRWDIALFGLYPPEALRQAHAPWLTGLLVYCYLAYYVSPLVIVMPAVLKRNWPLVRWLAGVYTGTLMVTYVGYILVPATGPRFEGGFHEAWLPDQPGWLFAEWWQRRIDQAEVLRWDAFPSGHTAVAVLAVLIALRQTRRIGLAYAPFVAGLVVATVYLGYHYATDVLAGLGVTLLGLLGIARLVRWWEAPFRRGD